MTVDDPVDDPMTADDPVDNRMTDDAIVSGVRAILADMDVYPATPGADGGATIPGGATLPAARLHLLRDLDLDSLKRIELVIRVENEFRVRLEPEDEAEITTLGDLVDVIRRRRAGAEQV